MTTALTAVPAVAAMVAAWRLYRAYQAHCLAQARWCLAREEARGDR